MPPLGEYYEEIDIDDIDSEEVILMTGKNETDMELRIRWKKSIVAPLDGQVVCDGEAEPILNAPLCCCCTVSSSGGLVSERGGF